jgi:hypothetical protein
MTMTSSSNTEKGVRQRKAKRVFKGAVVRIESEQIDELIDEAAEEFDVPSTVHRHSILG